jgi:VanZ family protein
LTKAKPSIAYAFFFLILCTILLTLPGSAFPKENWLDKIWFDKWVHIGMFGLLTVMWCWVIADHLPAASNLQQYFFIVAILVIGYGIAIEFIQQRYVSNRSFDKGDIIADVGGALAGYVFSSWRYIKK